MRELPIVNAICVEIAAFFVTLLFLGFILVVGGLVVVVFLGYELVKAVKKGWRKLWSKRL